MRTMFAALALFFGRAAFLEGWRSTASTPERLAPDPARTADAVVQVYGARISGWKGAFGVHTWIAVKPSRARAYLVYEVIGWRLGWADTVTVTRERAPDARWYGSAPELYAECRGEGVDDMIERIDAAAREYPYSSQYNLWPGPNSNTFTAWVLRRVPEMRADLPATAIGKDYLGGGIVDSAPSGSGVQVSLGGLAALTVSGVEGIEFNLLGLIFGVNPFDLSIKLPLLGRLGGKRRRTDARLTAA